MIAIYSILIILTLSFSIKVLLNFKMESSISSVLWGIGIILFVFGMFDALLYGFWTIVISSPILLISSIIKIWINKIKLNYKEFLTPGCVIFTFSMLVGYIIIKNTYFINWDEFSHWGTNLKVMLSYNTFWATKMFDGIHIAYPPLSGLIEYFFIKLNGNYVESVAFYALNTLAISSIIVIFQNIKWKHGILSVIFFLVIYLTIFICGFSLQTIYVDLVLSVMFLSGIILVSNIEKFKENKILFIMNISCIVLLKDTGLIFIGVLLLYLVINNIIIPIFKQKKIIFDYNVKNTIKYIFICLIVVVTFYLLWKMYLNINGTSMDFRHDSNNLEKVDIIDYVNKIFNLENYGDKQSKIVSLFYDALTNKGIIYNNSYYISAFGLIIILNIIFVLIYKKKLVKNTIAMWISLNIGAIIYCLAIMWVYMYVFIEKEGFELSSFSRYIFTYFYALIVFICYIIFSKDVDNNKNILKSNTIICLFICLYFSGFLCFIHPTIKNINGSSSEYATRAYDNISKMTNISDKIYIIMQDTTGYEFHIVRYLISPRRTNLIFEWSLGEKYNDEDLWSYDITCDEFESILINQNYNYVYLSKIDDRFIKQYSSLIADNIEKTINNLTDKLFIVEKVSAEKVVLKLNNQ